MFTKLCVPMNNYCDWVGYFCKGKLIKFCLDLQLQPHKCGMSTLPNRTYQNRLNILMNKNNIQILEGGEYFFSFIPTNKRIIFILSETHSNKDDNKLYFLRIFNKVNMSFPGFVNVCLDTRKHSTL